MRGISHKLLLLALVLVLLWFTQIIAQEEEEGDDDDDDDDDDEEVFESFGRSDETENTGTNDETDILTRIAQDVQFDRDYYEEETVLNNYDDEEELDVDSLLIQKLSDDQTMTAYYNFESDSYDFPVYRRKWEDYDTDFILFINPIFPHGTGHFIVLRKLKEELTVTAPEGEVDEEEVDDDGDSESIEAESESDEDNSEEEKEDKDDDKGDDNDQDEDQEEPDMLSGDENWADLYDEKGPLGESGDDIDPALKEKFDKFSNTSATGIKDPDEEIIYESFAINFKESILGYVSNINPIELVNDNSEDEESDEDDDDDGDDEFEDDDGDDDAKDKDNNQTRSRRHAIGKWSSSMNFFILTHSRHQKLLLQLQKVTLKPTRKQRARVCASKGYNFIRKKPRKICSNQCFKPITKPIPKIITKRSTSKGWTVN